MPVTAMAVGAVAAPVIGGLMGSAAAAKDRKQQKKMIKKALAELEKLGIPPDLSSPLILQEFQRAGVYTPELEEDLNNSISESEVAKIQEDPSLRKAQTEALTAMQQRAKVGLSSEDRASLNQVRNEVQRDAEAKRQQVLQQMQARGMGGSGASLVAQLQSGQDAENLASNQSDNLMAQAQTKALQALGQSSDMASNVRGQDFNVSQTKANALDERNRFLAENSIARQQRNVSGLNQAQLLNLQEQQRIADANAQQSNNELLRQRNEQGAFFDRKASVAGQRASAQLGAGSQYGQQAANTAASYSNMGAGIGTAFGALANSNMFKPSSSVDAAGGTTQYSKDYLAMGKAEGGIVGDEKAQGATRGPDNTVLPLREGEMVLNADQQRGLFDFLTRISNKYPKD